MLRGEKEMTNKAYDISCYFFVCYGVTNGQENHSFFTSKNAGTHEKWQIHLKMTSTSDKLQIHQCVKMANKNSRNI